MQVGEPREVPVPEDWLVELGLVVVDSEAEGVAEEVIEVSDDAEAEVVGEASDLPEVEHL